MKKLIITSLTMFMLITPIFSIPKLPTIPNISSNIKLPVAVEEAARKAGAEAAKKIDWSKFSFSFIK